MSTAILVLVPQFGIVALYFNFSKIFEVLSSEVQPSKMSHTEHKGQTNFLGLSGGIVLGWGQGSYLEVGGRHYHKLGMLLDLG